MISHTFNRSSFIRSVIAEAERIVRNANFSTSQQRLLLDTITRFAAYAPPEDIAQPLSLLYLVFRAWEREPDEQCVRIGAACFLYLCGGDLFDDVQDEDLEGKPHADTSPAVAMNSALALLFLAFEAVREGSALETDPDTRLAYLAAFNRYSVSGIGAQHGDLLGDSAASTTEEVIALHRGKASSMALLLECGAVLGGCSPEIVETYRRAGENLSIAVQIVDDVRDVFAKDESPDLAGRKMTCLLACFLESASKAERARLTQLLETPKESLAEIRELLYAGGAVEGCAAHVEALRLGIHSDILGTGNTHVAHRMLLTVVDALAEALYEPEPVAETAQAFRRGDGFHAAVIEAVEDFAAEMRPHGAPEPPDLVPWHLPYFLYDPARRTIHFPDVDDLPEEVLPFHAELFGTNEADAADALQAQLPLAVAHELFHHWRDVSGRITDDAWHEEYVVNRLTVAYALEHRPGVLAQVLDAGSVAKSLHPELLTPEASRVLERSVQASLDARGYEMDQRSAAMLHLILAERLAAERPSLTREIWTALHASDAIAASSAA